MRCPIAIRTSESGAMRIWNSAITFSLKQFGSGYVKSLALLNSSENIVFYAMVVIYSYLIIYELNNSSFCLGLLMFE